MKARKVRLPVGKRSRTKQQQAEQARQESNKATRRSGWRQRLEQASAGAEKAVRQRPPAPWDPFPLTELAIFIGIVFMVAGALAGLDAGIGVTIAAIGLVLACLGALDTTIREHFAGYRSHAMLMSGLAAAVSIGITTAANLNVPGRVAVALGIGLALFFPLRRAFLARSGGKPF